MNGSATRRIRVVFGRNPPDVFATCNQFPTYHPSIDCPFPGWTVEIITMMTQFLKIEVEPVILDDNIGNINWGYNNNGNWTGVLGMIQAGKADTMCVLFQYIADHAKYFSYSNPVTGIRDVYITHPKRKSISMSLWNAFFPYEVSVWTLILMALFLQSSLATFISKMEFKLNLRQYFIPSERFWHYLRLHIRQTTEFQVPFFLQSGNLSFVIYALMQATLFTNLYTAVILSALIRGENPRPFDSFNEMVSLIKSGEYSLVIDQLDYDEGSFLQTLSFTNISQLRNLHDAVKKNPIVRARSVFEALDFVERGGYIFPTRQDSLVYQLSKERCNLYYLEDENSQQPAFFIFSKNNPLLTEWNKAIRDNQPFIRRTFEKYFLLGYKPGAFPRCSDTAFDIPEASRPLDIVSTFGIFMIVLVGFGLSIFVFLFELYVDWQAFNLRLQRRTRQAMLTAPTHLLAIVRLFARTNCEHVIQTYGTEFPLSGRARRLSRSLDFAERRASRIVKSDSFDIRIPRESTSVTTKEDKNDSEGMDDVIPPHASHHNSTSAGEDEVFDDAFSTVPATALLTVATPPVAGIEDALGGRRRAVRLAKNQGEWRTAF